MQATNQQVPDLEEQIKCTKLIEEINYALDVLNKEKEEYLRLVAQKERVLADNLRIVLNRLKPLWSTTPRLSYN